jgi:sec-independent protein translocase protein TatA
MFGIGPLELIVVLMVALLIFGPKRLPDLGRSLGSGMREFKESVTGAERDELANADVPDARSPGDDGPLSQSRAGTRARNALEA